MKYTATFTKKQGFPTYFMRLISVGKFFYMRQRGKQSRNTSQPERVANINKNTIIQRKINFIFILLPQHKNHSLQS